MRYTGISSSPHGGRIFLTAHRGNITIPAGLNVWPHELRIAQALAAAGYDVEFVARREGEYQRTADLMIAGRSWGMKAPRSSNVKAVERNLKRARWQSPRIVLDSRRMKGLPDHAVEHALRKWSHEVKGVERVLFANRHGDVIDAM